MKDIERIEGILNDFELVIKQGDHDFESLCERSARLKTDLATELSKVMVFKDELGIDRDKLREHILKYADTEQAEWIIENLPDIITGGEE